MSDSGKLSLESENIRHLLELHNPSMWLNQVASVLLPLISIVLKNQGMKLVSNGVIMLSTYIFAGQSFEVSLTVMNTECTKRVFVRCD